MIRKAQGKPRLTPQDEEPSASKKDVAGVPAPLDTMAPEEAKKLLHELQIHQIELKTQNEELQQIHSELEASRSRYFDLYHLAPVGYCTVDAGGVIKDANLTAAELLGLPLAELLGRRIERFVFREDQDLFHLHRAGLMKPDGSTSCELRMVKHDGTEFWAHLETTAVGKREIHLVMSDITGRKQSEAALSASETLQMAILNSLPAHIAVLDNEGKILAVNEPWLKFARNNGDPDVRRIGVGADYFEACWSAYSEGDSHATAAVNGLKSVLSGEQSRFALEYPCDAPGRPRWFAMEVLRPVGDVGGAIVAHTDITGRTRARQLLAWEKSALEWIVGSKALPEVLEGLMRGLEEQMPGAICSVLLLDDDGVHLRHGAAPGLPDEYNSAIDGVAIGPTVGSCGTAVYEDRQVIVSDIGDDPLWADYRDLAFAHDLHACWSTPIHSRQGKTLGTFAIYYREPRHPTDFEMDVIERATHVVSIAIERSKAEEEIRRFNAELEQRVDDRTRELQTANMELESFSYSVSHDLRAPLRAIDGFTRMIMEDCAAQLDENGRRMLGVIHSEARRMGTLIDDLLVFSRLSRQSIEPTRISMETMAREVFDELAAREPERKLSLVLHPLPPIKGAEAMIRQVWVNLISNAIKFTKERKVGEIEIGSSRGGDRETIYDVKDNGAGFDMRHAEKLFGIFQRLHSQQEFPGTGIGLALVQRIVQRHGGRVWAEAEVGKGATFHFSIPDQIS